MLISALSVEWSYWISARGIRGAGVEAIDWRQTDVVMLEISALPLAEDNATRREATCICSFIFSKLPNSALFLFRVDFSSYRGMPGASGMP